MKRTRWDSAAGASGLVVRLHLDSGHASASELEPEGESTAAEQYNAHLAAMEPHCAAAYGSAVAEIASNRKDVQLEDHPGWWEPCFNDGASRKMLETMAAWKVGDITSAGLCEAHSALPGGGILRTTGIHVGSTRFAEPIGQLGALLTSLASAIQRLVAREDISVEAKAAWACYSLLALHPFPDGNGRLARALANV
eukprot:5693164-Prymnesium_polylepis.1